MMLLFTLCSVSSGLLFFFRLGFDIFECLKCVALCSFMIRIIHYPMERSEHTDEQGIK